MAVWDAADLIETATFAVVGLWVALQAWSFMRNRFSATRDQQLTIRWDEPATDAEPVRANAAPDITVQMPDAGRPLGAYAGARHNPAP
jgi:hypothetical protein